MKRPALPFTGALTAALTLASIGAGAACGDPVPADLESIAGYTSWKKVETSGPAPGHGDTYRIIYANDTSQFFNGQYPVGTVLVKEVYDRDGDGPGALRYVALMRQAGTTEIPDEGGWLFTSADVPFADETHFSYCWNRCHVQAPYAGAWLDYSK
jgi:hypothetical protein